VGEGGWSMGFVYSGKRAELPSNKELPQHSVCFLRFAGQNGAMAGGAEVDPRTGLGAARRGGGRSPSAAPADLRGPGRLCTVKLNQGVLFVLALIVIVSVFRLLIIGKFD